MADALHSSPLRRLRLLDKQDASDIAAGLARLVGRGSAARAGLNTAGFAHSGYTKARVRKPAGRVPTEEQVHRAIVDLLMRTRRPGVAFFHTPNGGKRHPVVAAKLNGLGTRAGVPDLQIIIGGRAHFLELKREVRGRLSDKQGGMIEELLAAGAVVEVAYGFDEALAYLKAWGAVR